MFKYYYNNLIFCFRIKRITVFMIKIQPLFQHCCYLVLQLSPYSVLHLPFYPLLQLSCYCLAVHQHQHCCLSLYLLCHQLSLLLDLSLVVYFLNFKFVRLFIHWFLNCFSYIQEGDLPNYHSWEFLNTSSKLPP